ncbi:MAG: signal recognition particle protein [Candidatus Aenigmarchaeota archaeon]|nr:signal recognition particle protein [Candidatus Aenigmarchaeota archaeon]
MLESLSKKLRSALQKISNIGSVDEKAVSELVGEIKRALVGGDVNVHLAEELAENIRKKSLGKLPAGMTRRELVVKTVYDELASIMGGEKPEIKIKPKKMLLVGLFGSGKTTTAAKLARFYQKKGFSVGLVCCDTVRPAAYEQLHQLSQQIGAQFYGEKGEINAAKIAKNALQKTKTDVIIFDSSGRDALDENLVKEIKSVASEAKPDERILVIPADIGQAAKEQSSAFQKALGITDVIVTKLDATAKGGGALTACYETGAKVIFVTVGEQPDKLEIYDSKRFVARLVGMPDLETLLEKAKAAVKPELTEKIAKADFDLEDFIKQMESMQSMGPLGQIVDMIGLGGKVPKDLLSVQEEKMRKWKHIMNSMTRHERQSPDIINTPRISRIAKGSGTSEQDVRELLGNYNKIKKMMKQFSPANMKRGNMAKLLRQFGGMKGLGL